MRGTAGSVRALDAPAAVVAASGGHPFTRFDLGPGFTAPALHLLGTTTVAWCQVWADGRVGVVVLGEDEDVGRLARTDELPRWVRAHRPHHVTAPVTAYPPVAEALALRGGNAWDRMWTTTQPPHLPAESGVEWCTGDPTDLTGFVREHHPRPHALPGQHPDQRWAVAVSQGRLLGCGCTEPGIAAAPLIGGIVVDAGLRGRGIGAALTAFLTRDALERTGGCILGVHDDNDHARGLYERLGYRTSLRARTGFPATRVSPGSRAPSRAGR